MATHRGRKSAAELAVLQPVRGFDRPAAPKHFNAAQRLLWERIVATKKPDFFDAAARPLLRSFVVNTLEAERLEKLLVAIDLKDADAADNYVAISKTLDRLQMRAQVLATSLRLTPQSRYSARKDSDVPNPDRPAPWNFGNPASQADASSR